uniref:Secreted protein n=1 Tax=Oryza sativa subsp. japonica TaxID=39947 RepID=Q8H2N6_ORYSJ|nr:hypothetical protein [Oryza sativa Japonica Group]
MDAMLGCCVLLVVGPASPAEAAYATEPASLASALHPQRPAQAAVYLYHSWLSWLLICGPRCSRSHLSLSLFFSGRSAKGHGLPPNTQKWRQRRRAHAWARPSFAPGKFPKRSDLFLIFL